MLLFELIMRFDWDGFGHHGDSCLSSLFIEGTKKAMGTSLGSTYVTRHLDVIAFRLLSIDDFDTGFGRFTPRRIY